MSLVDNRHHPLSDDADHAARNYADLIVEEFPEPDTNFSRRDIDNDYARGMVETLKKSNVLVVVEDYELKKPAVYRLDREVWRRANHHRDTREPLLPCGHSGLVHVESGTYECSYENCSKQFDRDQLKVNND
jgi:hypothetical protein